MQDAHDTNLILFALFQLSRDTCHVSATTLAAAAHTTPTRAARALVELERRGFVDATRARLTMPGLAAAAALAARGAGGPMLDLDAAKRARPASRPDAGTTQVPVAAGPLASMSAGAAEIGEPGGSFRRALEGGSVRARSATGLA